ncbi:hypothetical protein HZS_7059 [Henneguya salminicola]|nr:hypothetical protein HZS_7059 [Henneguya salminicola]
MCHRLKNSEREANIIILEGSTHTQASAYNELLLKFKAFQQNSYMGTSQLRSISHMLQNKDSDIPLFIVLNDMDIFCSFKKQSLLYILLDCIHNKSGGIFIIGITQNPVFLQEKSPEYFRNV